MSKVLFLSHTHRSGPFKVGSYHLSREIAAQGHDVTHISTPLSMLHLARGVDRTRRELAIGGPRRAADGVKDYIPLVTLPVRWKWTKGDLHRILNQVGLSQVDYCFIDQPLMATAMPEGTTTVFRPTDIKTRSADARKAERLVANLADGIAGTSPLVVESLPNPRRIPTTVIENGCETQRFLRHIGSENRRGFVYVGSLDHRFDNESVIRLAQAFPGEPVRIYGPAPTHFVQSARGTENLTFEGPIDYSQVPEVLGQAQVGLLPFTRTELNRSRSPMKLYEYLAAGLKVLGSEPTRVGDGAMNVTFSYGDDSPSMLVAAREALLAPVEGLSIADFVSTKDWSFNAEQLMAFAQGLRFKDGA